MEEAIAFILAIIITIVGFSKGWFKEDPAEKEKREQQRIQIEQQQAECEHDWVTTSRIGWGNNYEIYSKCSKCGKEI